MMSRSLLRTALLVALSVPALLGCVPSLSTTQETRFYVLAPLPADTAPLAGAPTDPPLIIDLGGVTIPQYLQRPQIVTRASENQLELAEFHTWGGSLEKDILSVLAANLGLLLATPQVHVASSRLPVGTDARLDVEVMAFERGAGGRVHLAVQWRLTQPDRERTPLLSRVSNLSSEVLPVDDLERSVAAMSALLGEFSVLVAQALLDTARRD